MDTHVLVLIHGNERGTDIYRILLTTGNCI